MEKARVLLGQVMCATREAAQHRRMAEPGSAEA